MILVTVELIPHGNTLSPRRKVLGTLTIANDGTGSPELGNYEGTLVAEYTGAAGRKGVVRGFRRRSQSVWTLIGAFLKGWGHTKTPRGTSRWKRTEGNAGAPEGTERPPES